MEELVACLAVFLVCFSIGCFFASAVEKVDDEQYQQPEEPKRKTSTRQIDSDVRMYEFMQNHPKLKDETTISRIKSFIAQKYAIHLMVKELYRLYFQDCDAAGKPPLSYRKWKFAYGL